MIKVLLVIHLVVTVIMIGLILLQRSEGGGLGIGGGSGGLGSFASARSTANALTRATMTFFALFVGLSLFLAILSSGHGKQESLIDKLGNTPAAVQMAPDEPVSEPQKPSVPVAP